MTRLPPKQTSDLACLPNRQEAAALRSPAGPPLPRCRVANMARNVGARERRERVDRSGLVALAERSVTYAASVPKIEDGRVSMLRVLSVLESRVLGVLVEKERTVPDSYPLTLNALVAGCNQKSSR